jgi:hypothetical protein
MREAKMVAMSLQNFLLLFSVLLFVSFKLASNVLVFLTVLSHETSMQGEKAKNAYSRRGIRQLKQKYLPRHVEVPSSFVAFCI